MSTGAHADRAREAGALTAQKDETAGNDLPCLCSTALLRGQKAVTIRHNGALYRLQTTRQGKLILTK
ncbi:MAG: hemin uptake protein HemP [Hydrogenophaga sp.]|uniref:hemin uptake protein HemP n=1 Tax=Hydrogenophaga sp. TaxID=1904254 RepID=UPI002632E404|nr:hemin uptake protein HemP [Hydrogenophaga sp.]MDM7941336.1 hemin uptake protein HemP [Hydrogenophaga sp.]